MDRREALDILAQHMNDKRIEQVDSIYDGLYVLRKHRHKQYGYRFEHDQMWVGDFDTTVETMTEDEVIRMARLGWFEDEDGWSHF